MKTKIYLQSLLEKSGHYDLNDTDNQTMNEKGIRSFIYQKLTSKKFRKTRMDPDCEKHTKNAIDYKISKNEPLTVLYPQGGYKLWRFPSSPRADWAEFFNISYVLQYIAPIAASYKPGVKIIYYMHTLLMELHDNLSTEEIQEYVDSFQLLINAFSKYLPKNVNISIMRDADIYTRYEYLKALDEGKKKAEIEYRSWPQAKKDDYARMSMLNIKWNGKKNWTLLNESEKQEKIYQAALYETAAVHNLPRVFEKVKSPENILVFTKATRDFIGIGSTRASSAKYWVGFGILARDNDHLKPIVLTPNQYESLMRYDHRCERVNFLEGRNFDEIIVADESSVATFISCLHKTQST